MTTQTEFEKAIETANRCNRPNSSDFFIGEFNLTVFAECIASKGIENEQRN